MKTIGRYELLDRLGEGSMGVIYRAKDAILEREVALKTLSTAGVRDAELLERFYREARAYARLHHPNIVTVYDFGREKDVAYIAMELLEGSDLKKIIAGGATMTLAEKLQIMAAVCDGLAHAHSIDIVHRDIKPSNIFLSADGQPRILDFGVAHMPLSSLTITGHVLGTPHYMSPEQMLGEACDGRSDIFSAAIVTFELISGQHLFGGSPAERIASATPDSLRDHCPGLSIELDAVLRRALSRDPADRYSSAAEFASALRQPFTGRQPEGAIGNNNFATGTRESMRPAAGTETIMSAVLMNLMKFEDAADRRDLTVAREALAGMQRAGAQDTRYAVALKQSAKRLAELESADAGQARPLQIPCTAVKTRPASPSVEITLGAHKKFRRPGLDATVLFESPVTPAAASTLTPVPLPPLSRAVAPLPPHRPRVPWTVWAGVLAVVVAITAFLFTRGNNQKLESLPATVAVPSISETRAPAVSNPPLPPDAEPTAIPHTARPSRPPLQLKPIEVKAKPVFAPTLAPPPPNLLPQQPTVAPVEPPIVGAEEKRIENATPPAPVPMRRIAPDLEMQHKAGQELFKRMLLRLGDIDSPPALSLAGSAILWTGGQRTDCSVSGNVNVQGQMLTLEIQQADLRWRASLKGGISKMEGSNKLKGSAIALDIERLSQVFYDNQPAVLAARFKAVGLTQMICDLSTDEQGDRVLQVQVGADRYRVLIAPDGTPLRLHAGGLEIAYAGFEDFTGYLFPKVFAMKSLAVDAAPATVLRFDSVRVAPSLFQNVRRR